MWHTPKVNILKPNELSEFLETFEREAPILATILKPNKLMPAMDSGQFVSNRDIVYGTLKC